MISPSFTSPFGFPIYILYRYTCTGTYTQKMGGVLNPQTSPLYVSAPARHITPILWGQILDSKLNTGACTIWIMGKSVITIISHTFDHNCSPLGRSGSEETTLTISFRLFTKNCNRLAVII